MPRLRVLVIDDDALVLLALSNLLKAHEVATASNVGDARATLLDSRFDLIVSDVQLPDGLGNELLPWMRAEGLEIPEMVLITGSVEPIDTELRTLRKPFITAPLLEIADNVSRRLARLAAS